MSTAAPSAVRRWWQPGDFFALGWTRLLLLLLLAMAVLFVAFGFFLPYWRKADQDLALAYEAMLFNQGLPQENFDHTGHLTFLLLGSWYWLLHTVGVLPVHTIAELPPARDTLAYEAAWQHLVAAGRVFSLLLAGGFVVLFGTLVRRLFGDWRLALLASIALGFSSGIELHARMMRTELLSAALTGSACLLLLIAAQDSFERRRSLFLAVAALAATLAVITKVQAIIIALALPVIVLPFGRAAAADEPANGLRTGAGATMAWGVTAAVAGIPAAILYLHGYSPNLTPLFAYPHLGLLPEGSYQALFAFWVVAGILLYARIWRRRAEESLRAMFAVLTGVALGVLALLLRYNDQNLIAFTHPVEHLYFFASLRTTSLASSGQILSPTLLAQLAQGVLLTIVANINLFNRPTVLLEWFAIGGAVVMMRRGDRSLVYRVGILLAVAWAIEIVFSLRYLNNNYFPYTDPLFIIAAALVAVEFPDLWAASRAQTNLAIAVVVYCVLGSVGPIGLAFDRRGPEGACAWLPSYLKRVEPFPFCQAAPPAADKPG